MESHNVEYDIAPEIDEFRRSPHKKFSALNVSKRGTASHTAVHELLECPICMNVMYPPIQHTYTPHPRSTYQGAHLGTYGESDIHLYQLRVCTSVYHSQCGKCLNGHTLCSKCQFKVRRCPICRHELGNIRCLALERVAESLELPCKYQILGCQDIFPYPNKLRHEHNCRFRPYGCPYAGAECPATGDVPFLVEHLQNDHKVDMHDGCTFNHRYVKSNPQDVENATWMLTVFNCYGYQFCLHFEAFNLGMAPVYMAFVRFMGDDHDARKFCYSLEVGSNGRKLTWHGIPRSIRDSHTKVRDSMDGLIIQRNMALFFSGGNRQELKLKVAGRIWKEQS
ncbi:E3 ubiquitin-protein ligase sinat2 [Orobanche minor]